MTRRTRETATARQAPRSSAERPAGPRLTTPGVAVLVGSLSCLAAWLNMVATGSVGMLFAVVFVLAAVAGAWFVRPADLVSAVVVPPLAYAAGLAVAVQMGALTISSGLVASVMAVIALLVLDPAPLLVGTALTAVLVLYRRVRKFR
jgi:hypothetical protein